MTAGRLWTALELAQHLGFSYFTLVKWAAAGLLPSIKMGSRWRFDLGEVMAAFEDGTFARKREELSAQRSLAEQVRRSTNNRRRKG